jgi:hypothetical protein
VIINMRSKEINLDNKRLHRNTRYVVMNYSNGVSTIVYKSPNILFRGLMRWFEVSITTKNSFSTLLKIRKYLCKNI